MNRLFRIRTPKYRADRRLLVCVCGENLRSASVKAAVHYRHVGRKYSCTKVFPYYKEGGKGRLISEADMRRSHPKTWEYLTRNKQLLASREHGKFKSSGWYQLYPKNLDFWEQTKILIPYMVTELAAYPDQASVYFVNVTTGGFGVTFNDSNEALEYNTGVLNSHVLDWFLKQVSTTFHGGYFAANKQFLVQLPIRRINFSDPADKVWHDKVVQLVESMLALHKHKAAARTQGEQEPLQRQIDATDRQIDALVYELYGLTAEEIAIVEGAG